MQASSAFLVLFFLFGYFLEHGISEEVSVDAKGAVSQESAEVKEKEEEAPVIRASNLTKNWTPDRSEAWGDVQMVGGGQGWEFVKGLFGSEVTCHPQRLVMAHPIKACQHLKNPDEVKGAIVLVGRGECSFADKTAFAQTAGAKGVIVWNTANDLLRMPAGWMKFEKEILIKIPTVIVTRDSGLALAKIMKRDPIHVQIVAKHWEPAGEYQTGHCVGNSFSKEKVVDTDGTVLTDLAFGEEGGQIHVVNSPTALIQSDFEYLLGKFGGPRPSSPREIVWADPVNACAPLKNADSTKGKFVLAKRGGCAFTDKALFVEKAGGMGAIVINNAGNLVQMAKGDVPDWQVTIPTAMITNQAGSALEELMSSSTGLKISFQKRDVQAQYWDGLNELKAPQKWPAEFGEREKLFNRLAAIHDPKRGDTGSKERIDYLTMLHNQATKFWGASV